MQPLITNPPKRFFTFGCSFTNYHWSTWADIVAKELKVPFYNYGRTGAGNQYIFNTIMQADALYNFNEDDLVMVCWSSITREDRFTKDGWITPGNIYSQSQYDIDFVKKWVDPTGCAIRDFALIKGVTDLLELKNISHHQMKMLDFNHINQFKASSKLENEEWVSNLLVEMYQPTLNKISESFYKVLWDNNIDVKVQSDQELIGKHFFDGHPFPSEAFTYLQHLFDHTFSIDTTTAVAADNDTVVAQLLEWSYLGYSRRKFSRLQNKDYHCKVATEYLQLNRGCI